MSLFDFFRKKELQQIAVLTEQIKDLQQQVEKLSPYQEILDLDNAINERQAEYHRNEAIYQQNYKALENQLENLRFQYQNAKHTYDRLNSEIAIYKEDLNLTEYGVYEPHFAFECSDDYKDAIKELRIVQKRCIANGNAIIGGDSITWNDSKTQGAAMVKRQKKLMMRAFNGECDSFIANVSWNNIERMQERIQKSFDAINGTYSMQGIQITEFYKKHKLNELQLAYEYKHKKEEEKQEQRAIREQMREEARANRDFENARIQAEREERNYQAALERARQQLLHAHGEKELEMQRKIQELEEQLFSIEEKKARVLSMAQQTKIGHVYVISNLGSFGEGIYKIGMTRRLDPFDRVIELGDASVPFRFDVHAMIFSHDAPALEATIHRAFNERRVNLINTRKEFFHVTLDEIAQVVEENCGHIEFTKLAEAVEFRESYAIKLKAYEDYQASQIEQTILNVDSFPDTV